MVRIWEKFLRENSGATRLPVVVPVVLGHNAHGWEATGRFSDLFEVSSHESDGLLEFLPDYRAAIFQLATASFEELAKPAGSNPVAVMLLRVLKAEQAGMLLGELVWYEELLVQLSRELLETFFAYILKTPNIDFKTFERRVINVRNSTLRETAMSAAEELIQRGRQEAQQQSVLRLLNLRFGRVPQGLREAVEGIESSEHLNRLIDAAAISHGLEEFSQAL